jgi:hypothetical protein
MSIGVKRYAYIRASSLGITERGASMKNILDIGKTRKTRGWEKFHAMYDEGGTSGNEYLTAGSGYWNDANQYRFILKIPKNADLNIAQVEIEKVVPLMKIVRITLVCYHTLENNHHDLIIEKNKWAIEQLVYGSRTKLIPFKNLHDALKHIQNEYKNEE